MTPDEIPLEGGHVNEVVRVGNTVRRTAGPWTPTVHALLRHLEDVGFDEAPRALGIDERGREVLSYVEGDVVAAGTITEIEPAARLLRRYHDAVADFAVPADARWRPTAPHPPDGEIVCHNDVAPYNTVYRHGRPVALIDWDLAAPAPRMWDVAYAVWRFVPLYWDVEVPDRAARLHRFCDAYGLDDRSGLLDAVAARMVWAAETVRRWTAESVGRFVAEPGHAGGPARDLAWLHAHRAVLE
jgi:Ser/Thr protein kinase RdoA (MazF antagonist)